MIIRSKLNFIEIEQVEPFGNLTKNNAMQLRDYLRDCVNQERCCQLIDFKRVNKVDETGANVLADFYNSKLYIALFNVKAEILTDLNIPEDLSNIKIYNEQDSSNVVPLIRQDLLMNLQDTKH